MQNKRAARGKFVFECYAGTRTCRRRQKRRRRGRHGQQLPLWARRSVSARTVAREAGAQATLWGRRENCGLKGTLRWRSGKGTAD
eukprot:6183945-Pleurochrysis_carterae.AAC.2